jgi:hypothetical protein
MKKKPNVIVYQTAARWEAHVLQPTTGEYVVFNMRKMTGKERSEFHREFMNAFRESVK